MPNKIKIKEEKKLGNVNEEERINKAKKGIFVVAIIGILVMLVIGMFIFFRDRGYKYSNNPVVKFSYSEGRYNEGFDVYELEVKPDQIFALHNLDIGNENITKKWSQTKYLNFNEELYESGVLDFKEEYTSLDVEDMWSFRLEIKFENGEEFVSIGMGEHPENTEKFKKLIKKYFAGDIKI